MCHWEEEEMHGSGMGLVTTMAAFCNTFIRSLEWVGRLKIIQFHGNHKQGTFNYPRFLQAPSSLALDTSKDGAAAASLGTPFQPLTTLPGKNSFPISYLILPSGTGKPFLSPHPFSQVSLQLSWSLFKRWKVSLDPSLLRVEHPQLSQPGSRASPWPPLDLLQQVRILLLLGPQSWTQNSRWDLRKAEQRGRIVSVTLLAIGYLILFLLPQYVPRTFLHVLQPVMDTSLAFLEFSGMCWVIHE
ncbi:hypothetical protein DUI87_06872 [Hirundo rustica rustica]|uniref:Uncharacterized protein n=1 Tax=Hirundo rustica rustica TaxID=333673 RepID=A0A3M0KV90_HIRRU|nr:hypothetical protein DUI87_06872 [Hirundo rustica rustica]